MRKVFAVLQSAVGRDEAALLLGLTLLTVALWAAIGVIALAVPGAAITWLALPSRLPLVQRPSEPENRRTH